MREPTHHGKLRQFLLVGVVACYAGLGAIATRGFAAETAETGLQIKDDKSTITILDGERAVLRYRYGDVPMKPCVDQLFTPAGVQVLRDSPSDHKHHHALMFALEVDGVNFWEEGEKSGKEKHVNSFRLGRFITNDGPVLLGKSFMLAQLSENLEWVDSASDKPLLIERRTISVKKATDLGATLITWESRLSTPPGKDSVTLTGHHYFGLGMRFVQSMDKGGRFFNADDKAGEIVRGDERLTPTKWCAYTAKADGKPVTVAIFDSPDNPRYPARMFTMSKPFAYLSATRNEWKEPLVVKADKPLEVEYHVALWDGEIEKATVEKLCQRFLQPTTDREKK